jgi:hypothetical protein
MTVVIPDPVLVAIGMRLMALPATEALEPGSASYGRDHGVGHRRDQGSTVQWCWPECKGMREHPRKEGRPAPAKEVTGTDSPR